MMKTTVGALVALGMVGGSMTFIIGGRGEATPSPVAVVPSVQPAPNSVGAAPDAALVVDLSEPLDATAFDPGDFSVFGRWSGVVRGRVEVEDGGSRLRFTPETPFQAGEWVTASLRRGAATASGASLPTAFTWNFWIGSEPGSLDFTDRGERTVMAPGEDHVQPYGAYAGDFNGDGFPDLAIPNEVSADVRIMLNDGEGNYRDFTVLDIPSGNFPSPNEGADFNRDGLVDFAVGNAGNELVTVFVGDGAGGFRVGGNYPAGDNVRGVCIMDLNGDGWPDVATANMGDGTRRSTRGTVSILLNDGSGRLGPETTIQSPGRGEKTCATGDANGDGLEDLFVGAFHSDEVLLYLGDGEGGLELSSRSRAGGSPWMVVAADVNGDGHVDAISANRGGDNVGILLGDGAGGLSESVTYPVGDQPLAVDVGDLDGDGDLDVVSSDFSGNTFTIYENAGDGTLVNPRTLPASTSGSCAIIHDRDRDGDLDITGVDEMADKIFLFENPGR